MEAILIPVKRLADATARLAGVLDPSGRRRLALAMLTDVVAAAEAWPIRMVVTADPEAAVVARSVGWRVLDDPGSGLNGAVAAGTVASVAAGASSLLVLPFDVPLVTPDELRGVFAVDADVVVARSDDGGTSALLRRPPGAIAAAVGAGSAAVHAAAALRAGLRVASIRVPGLNLDVDESEDLRRLAASGSVNGSARIARELLANSAPG